MAQESEHLPADHRKWPVDPFELLGVTRSSTEKDAKRAYTRLIKQYKPEHAPEQFQLIRKAYESVQWYLKLYAPEPATTETEELPAPISEPEQTSTPIDENSFINEFAENPLPPDKPLLASDLDQLFGRTASDKPPPVKDLPPPPEVEKPSDICWNMVMAGETVEAYQLLQQLLEKPSRKAEAYFQLYWLLTFHPELDPTRQPIEYLIRLLEIDASSHRVIQAVQQELNKSPEAALSDQWEAMLPKLPRSSDLCKLLTFRIEVLCDLREYEVVLDLLKLYSAAISIDNELELLNLLVKIMGRVVWFPQRPECVEVRKFCLQSIRDLEHLSVQASQTFDDLDYLRETVSSWLKCVPNRNAKSAVLLMREAWSKMHFQIGHLVEQFAAEVMREPIVWLNRFDRMYYDGGITALAFMQVNLESHFYTLNLKWEGNPVPATWKREMRQALKHSRRYLLDLRKQIVDIAFTWGVSVDAIAQEYSETLVQVGEEGCHLSAAIYGDVPLRILSYAQMIAMG
ncbi:MAG: J domain-containing protein [Zavarzinella sp.]